MANTLITNEIICKEMLAEVHNNLVVGRTVNRKYEANYKMPLNGKTGPTVKILRPTRFTVHEGRDITGAVQDITQREVDLTIAYQDNVAVSITTADRELKLDDFRRTIATPAGIALANKVDSRLITEGMNTFSNWVGSVGTAVNTFNTINAASGKLTKFGVSPAERYVALNVNDYVALGNALQNSFNVPLNTSISQRAQIKRLADFDVMQDQNMTTHTVGAYGGTPLVNGGSQSGTTLVTDGWSTSVTGLLKAGDRFTIAGVYSVNPQTRVSTGDLAQFIVTADVNSDSGGNATIPISLGEDEGINLTGPYQNVSAAPANNAAITVLGTASTPYNVNFAYQREAFTLAVIEFPKTQSASFSHVESDPELGLSLRMNGFYDGLTDTEYFRFDILYGVKAFSPYGCVIVS